MAIIVSAHHGAIAVVHGRRVDAVFVLAAQARSGTLSPLTVLTAASPPPSSSATGVFSWSCVHSPLKLVHTRCKSLQISKIPPECGSTAACKAQPGHTLILLLRSCELRRNTLWNEPQNLQKTALANENLNRLQFSVYRIRRRRLRMADAEGLRGNEA